MARSSPDRKCFTEEADAMRLFYGNSESVRRLEVARPCGPARSTPLLDTSNLRLQEMLERKLREDRYLLHAARTSYLVSHRIFAIHTRMDNPSIEGTLFLHEDTAVQTIASEIALQEWRLAGLGARCTDPGRPAYKGVFPGYETNTTQHRWHSTRLATACYTNLSFYPPEDCPGVYPSSASPYPVVDALLSIPFPLLHNFPRFASLTPSPYKSSLVMMAQVVISVWWWDPDSDELRASEGQALTASTITHTVLAE